MCTHITFTSRESSGAWTCAPAESDEEGLLAACAYTQRESSRASTCAPGASKKHVPMRVYVHIADRWVQSSGTRTNANVHRESKKARVLVCSALAHEHMERKLKSVDHSTESIWQPNTCTNARGYSSVHHSEERQTDTRSHANTIFPSAFCSACLSLLYSLATTSPSSSPLPYSATKCPSVLWHTHAHNT